MKNLRAKNVTGDKTIDIDLLIVPDAAITAGSNAVNISTGGLSILTDNLEWCDTPHNINWRSVLGRTAQGDAHPNSKIQEKDIPIIRQRIADGDTLESIGNDYGVSKHPIWAIKHRKWWKHVT